MDIKIFFSPVEEEAYAGIHLSNSFYKNIHANTEKMPDHRGADIALIGLTETRGTSDQGMKDAARHIRQKLYKLKKGTGSYRIVDLGNLRNGVDHEETLKRIKEVGQILIDQNVLPIFFGGSHDADYGQYMAYEGIDKLVSFLNVDAFLDMEEGTGLAPNEQHIQKVLLHEPNYLFNYSQLAYQSYLIDQNTLHTLEKLYFEAYRVGLLHANIKEMEPIIRNADLLSFDISAIRASDAPGNSRAQPFGLTGEEACQICWYAGLNEKLSSLGIYEYNPALDDDKKSTASVVATMIWYFIEGFYHRKKEKDFKSNDYLKYLVSMPADPATLSFYKSKLSEKWWMEVPFPLGKEKYARNCIVPCSYADYEAATKGEVPERYISTHAKLL